MGSTLIMEITEVMEERIKKIEEEQATIKAALAENTRMTKETHDNTADLVAMFKTGQAAAKMFIGVGNFAKAIAYISAGGASLAAVWHYITHYTPKL